MKIRNCKNCRFYILKDSYCKKWAMRFTEFNCCGEHRYAGRKVNHPKNIKEIRITIDPKFFDIIKRTPILFEKLGRYLDGSWQRCNHTEYGKLKNRSGLESGMVINFEERK